MATKRKITLAVKVVLFMAVGGGIFVLAGCVPRPLTGDKPGQPAAASTPATDTPTVPIKTTPVVPTESPPATSPTLTPDPSAAFIQSSTSFEEPFDDNRNNWPTDPTLMTISDGTYHHKIACPDSNATPRCGTFIKVPFSFPRNFRMEIDAMLVGASPGASVTVAFEVRRAAEYYYITYLLTDGLYQISRNSQFGIFSIVPETASEYIKTAAGDMNTIGIEVKDTSLTPLLNGHELAPAFDGKIPKAGDSYLVILVTRGHSAEIELDNLNVQEVN